MLTFHYVFTLIFFARVALFLLEKARKRSINFRLKVERFVRVLFLLVFLTLKRPSCPAQVGFAFTVQSDSILMDRRFYKDFPLELKWF